jgi:uncharacterized HhH-GPD family protein
MPDALYFTADPEANALLAHDPLALTIGFVLDQQVSVQKAFSSPLELSRRLGGLDARRIAATDPAALEAVFREKPALHRFPGNMAKRVQEHCAAIAGEYGGDASRVWTEARDSDDLRVRLEGLPGFGEMKVKAMAAVLSKRFGVRVADDLVPPHPTLGDVDSPAALDAYQAQKRAYKAAQKSGGEPPVWPSS